MVPPIGFNGSMPPRMNPDAYAQQYATQNGITFEAAQAELRSKYGAPQAQGAGIGISFGENSFQNYDSVSFSTSNISSQGGTSSSKGFFQQAWDFITGNTGPQNEGDPQPHLNAPSGANGPQNEGDPQPHLGTAGQQDPDAYAQQYADENGITLEEAIAQLKIKYGAPNNPFGA